MRINYDFRDIEAFLAVADHASFQIAASQLNMSQPTLTRRIQKLEKALATQLFERSTRSVRLTLAARGFRDRARAMLEDAEETQRALTDSSLQFEAQRNAMITIATIPSATHNILPNAINEFRRKETKVRFRILENLANETMNLVAQGEADFGITFGGLSDPTLDFQPLLTDKFVIALHRSHPLCAQASVRWADLKGCSFLAPWKGSGNRLLIDNALAETRQSLEWTCEIRHSSTMLSMVRSQVGIAALPLSVLPKDDNTPIAYRALTNPEVMRTIGVITRRSQTLPKSVRAFLEIIFSPCPDI